MIITEYDLFVNILFYENYTYMIKLNTSTCTYAVQIYLYYSLFNYIISTL